MMMARVVNVIKWARSFPEGGSLKSPAIIGVIPSTSTETNTTNSKVVLSHNIATVVMLKSMYVAPDKPFFSLSFSIVPKSFKKKSLNVGVFLLKNSTSSAIKVRISNTSFVLKYPINGGKKTVIRRLKCNSFLR